MAEAQVPRCNCCHTRDVAILLECHNSACRHYADPQRIYEGWRSAQEAPAMPATWMKRIDAAAQALSLIQSSNNLGTLETMASRACEGLRGILSDATGAAPAAVAGPSEENLRKALRGLLEIEDARIATGAFQPNAEARSRIDFARETLAAAPTTLPAPQQEPDEIRSYTAARAWVARAAQEGKSCPKE